jgi:hypothetical protein
MRAQGLESRLAEVLMSALSPCDLGDGIEVVHDTETLEVEMECSVDEETAVDDELGTHQFVRVDEELGTHQFVRFSAPYERIEVQIDASAFRRATIEEAKRLHWRNGHGEASDR